MSEWLGIPSERARLPQNPQALLDKCDLFRPRAAVPLCVHEHRRFAQQGDKVVLFAVLVEQDLDRRPDLSWRRKSGALAVPWRRRKSSSSTVTSQTFVERLSPRIRERVVRFLRLRRARTHAGARRKGGSPRLRRAWFRRGSFCDSRAIPAPLRGRCAHDDRLEPRSARSHERHACRRYRVSDAQRPHIPCPKGLKRRFACDSRSLTGQPAR